MSAERAVSRRGFLRGTAGAAALAGASGAATAQEDGGSVTVNLVDYAYEPGTEEPLVIPPGTTVEFVWETPTHNIHLDSKPAESDWQGVEEIHDTGYTHSHTFTVTGDYHFWCVPHQGLGMVGDISVEEGATLPGQGGGEGGGGGPAIPDSAKTIGIATSVAMGSTLALAYAFLKYGGGKPAE